MAKYISFVLAALSVLVAFTPSASGQSDKDAAARVQATALFAKALALTDLRAPDSPPFELRGTINAHQRGDKDLTGTYLLKWASPEEWRQEVHFLDYTRVRVGGKNQYWQSRTTSYEVQPVLELDQGLGFLKEFHVWAHPGAMKDPESVKLHRAKVEKIKSDCVTLTLKKPQWHPDYCFDPGKGTLVSENGGYREYSGFTPFAGRLFPGNIRIKDSSAAPITFVVNSILPLGSTDSGDFQPAAGATAWPSCDNPDSLPKIRQQAFPVYPVSEKLAHMQGTVNVYGVIGVDGLLYNLKVLSAPDIGLANSTVAVLEQWEYAPETCRGTPVPVETLLTVIYNLGGVIVVIQWSSKSAEPVVQTPHF